ncbi:MAG: 16S rRNA (uracil(1498)-N(3))-methyltransferase [Gemmatimonadales bacterium]|nr:16S rRNA (uracil(1498)-N(3))-methyltransferase [Gemmatimonadales bacterium]
MPSWTRSWTLPGGPSRLAASDCILIVLVPPGALRAGDTIDLDEDEVHHLRVRRAIPRSSVDLRDGAGLVGSGELIATDARRAQVLVNDVTRAPPPEALELLVAAGDKERFGWLVEKAAELGVTRVVPVETERVRGVASRVTEAQLPRLGRRALDAIKQSGSAWAPVIMTPVEFERALTQGGAGERWLADAAGDWPSGVDAATPLSVLVGPEGGLSESERTSAVAAGWRPTRLGDHVLRFETAAVAAAMFIGIARGRGAP